MMIYFSIYHDGQHNFTLMTTACDRALSDTIAFLLHSFLEHIIRGLLNG